MLAVVGHTTRDLVDASTARPGGAPLFAARALRAVGQPGVVVTRCAADDVPVLERLGSEAVRIVCRDEASAPAFRLSYHGAARDVEIEALGRPWLPEDVDGWLGESLAGADWVHAGALWRGEFPAETLARLAGGRTLSLDGQGLVRPGTVGPVVPDADYDPAVLEHVSVLHLSEDEAGVLGLAPDAPALRELGVPEVVVTLGDRGSLVHADGTAVSVPATPVADADTTGAGDAFMTAYLACRRLGEPPAAAAGSATAVVRELLMASAG